MKFIKYLPLVLLASINMQAGESTSQPCAVKNFLQAHRMQLATGALFAGTAVLKARVIPEGIAQTVTDCTQGAVLYHFVNSIKAKNQDLNVRGLAIDAASIGVASVADQYFVQGVELLPERVRRYVKAAIGGQEGNLALVRRGVLFYVIRDLAERAEKATLGKR